MAVRIDKSRTRPSSDGAREFPWFRLSLPMLGVLAAVTMSIPSDADAGQRTVYGVSRSTVVVAAPRPVVVAPAPRAVVVAPAPRAVVVAPAPAVVGLPAGYIAILPTGYTIRVVGGVRYYYVGGIHYRAEFYQGRTVYVRVRL